MMLAHGPQLVRALQEEGVPFPDECGDVEVHVPVDGAMTIKFVVFVTPDKLEKIGRALVRVAKEMQE